MDSIQEILASRGEHLLGRLSGPLNFRLLVMPIVVTILAVLADRRDAREGHPARLGAFIRHPAERRRLARVALKDIGRVFVVAIVLDTAYQLMVLRWVYPGEVLLVAIVCAIVPYVLVRGPILRIIHLLGLQWARPVPMPDGGDAAKADHREQN